MIERMASKSPVAVLVAQVSREDLWRILCPACEGDLEISQPSMDEPERLLAVCLSCRTWIVVDLIPDNSATLIVALPDADGFRQAAAHQPAMNTGERPLGL